MCITNRQQYSKNEAKSLANAMGLNIERCIRCHQYHIKGQYLKSARCDTKKKSYASYQSAWAEALVFADIYQSHMHPYQCTQCDKYHLTSKKKYFN